MEETPKASTTPEFAGIGQRFLAALVDGILISIVTGIINGIFSTMFGLGGSMLSSTETLSDEAAAGLGLAVIGGSLLMVFINLVISWGYYVYFTGSKGATLGKMLFKIQVVDENYQKISFGKAALREIIGKFVSSFVFGLGYIWTLFDEKKQSWHDKIAKTYVIKKA